MALRYCLTASEISGKSTFINPAVGWLVLDAGCHSEQIRTASKIETSQTARLPQSTTCSTAFDTLLLWFSSIMRRENWARHLVCCRLKYTILGPSVVLRVSLQSVQSFHKCIKNCVRHSFVETLGQCHHANGCPSRSCPPRCGDLGADSRRDVVVVVIIRIVFMSRVITAVIIVVIAAGSAVSLETGITCTGFITAMGSPTEFHVPAVRATSPSSARS